MSDALPEGWRWSTIGDIAAYVQRGKSPRYAPRSALPVVNQRCVRWHGVDTQHLKFIDESQWADWGDERTLRDGDILWNSTGTGTIGRAAIFRPLPEFERIVADSHVTVIRPKTALPEFLHSWIKSPMIQARIDEMQSGSTNQVELARSEVLKTRVPLAPLAEQRRIVAKLEALQARSRRAKEALDTVPALLEKLRQSILAAAFRGDLTKDWRAQNPNVEPANELLKRIRAERRAKWEQAELAKLKAKGKTPSDDKWKAKYKEPEPVDTAGLPELPLGWCWASVEQVSTLITSGSRGWAEFYASAGPIFIRSQDINADRLELDECAHVQLPVDAEGARTRVNQGDVLITITGANVTRCAWVVEEVDEAYVSQHVALVRPLGIPAALAHMWLIADSGGRRQLKAAAYGLGKPGLNLSDVAGVVIPLASAAEQREIVACLQQRLADLDLVRDRLIDQTHQLADLDRSTLAKAFRGELVPQDSNDEPPGAMLERARTETDAECTPAPWRGRKAKG